MILTTKPVFSQHPVERLEWKVAARLQDQNNEGKVSLGFAGVINAVDGNALMVAGGANFPDKMPWDGGKKYYSDEIHILQKSGQGLVWNTKNRVRLPEPIAYCGNTATPDGVVYAGGENENGLSNKAYLLNWHEATNQVQIKPLPDLPLALTNLALTSIGHVVYAVGGDGKKESSAAVFSIDLSLSNCHWIRLPDMPVALANAVVVTQNKGIYVVGGRSKTPAGISTLRSSTFYYNLDKQSWATCSPISDGNQITNFSAGAGVAIGDQFILLTGGDNGVVFHQIEKYLVQIANTENPEEKAKLLEAKNKLSTGHKGFYRGILLYDTIQDSWTKIGELPFPAQVTTTATLWDGQIFLSSGEVKPGVRTADINIGTIK